MPASSSISSTPIGRARSTAPDITGIRPTWAVAEPRLGSWRGLVQVRAHADTVDDRGPTVVSQQLFSIELACEVTLGTVAHALPLDLLTDALLRQAVMVELDLWEHAAGDDVWPTDWATPLPTGQEHPTPDGSVALLPDQTTAVYLAEPVADVIAVTCTAILFATQFRKALHKLEANA